MAPRSKLKVALAAEKGLTDLKLKQSRDKKKHKAVVKDKRKKGLIPDEPVQEEDSEDDDEESDEDAEGLLDIEAEETDDDEDDEEDNDGLTSAALLDESDSDSESEVEIEEKIVRPKNPNPNPKSILRKGETQPKKAAAAVEKKKKDADAEEDDQEDDEEDSDIALSDLEDMPEEDREDLYVKTRLTINNQPALLAALKRISMPKGSDVPFASHQVVVSADETAPKIEDISDDLARELQLYAQSLGAAKRARALLRAEGAVFSRPTDYFAEMVKDDGHMQKVKDKLVEDATNKKASAEARKLRDLKKFGKQVQVAKLQERHKEKRETLEKIKALKKKRSENGGEAGTTEADLFDVGVDNELNKSGKRSRDDDGGGRGGGGNNKRAKKDSKFGFGGKKRHGKSGDAASSGDLSGFSQKRMKRGGQAGGPSGGKPGGKPKTSFKTARLGKNKRQAKR